MVLKLADTRQEALIEIWKEFKSPSLTQKIFLGMFNGLCKYEFTQCVTEMNDYGSDIVLKDDLDQYIWVAEHRAFPQLWKVIALMCSVNAK